MKVKQHIFQSLHAAQWCWSNICFSCCDYFLGICWVVTEMAIQSVRSITFTGLSFLSPPLLSRSGTGCRRSKRTPSLDSRVCVSSSCCGQLGDLYLNEPISFPLLGQWANQNTDKCHQDNCESAVDNKNNIDWYGWFILYWKKRKLLFGVSRVKSLFYLTANFVWSR